MQGERVYVAEHGHGARAGTVVRRYTVGEGFGLEKIVVQLDDQERERHCYASSVYPTREAAEEASR